MTKEEFKKQTLIAMRYAKSRGFLSRELREDFAQEFILAYLENRSKRLTYLYTDFMRKLYGRNDKYGSDSERAKSLALLTMAEYNDDPSEQHDDDCPLPF